MKIVHTNKLVNKVNLFVLGAQKAGTSSLHYYLQHVEDVFMCHAKETFFFTQKKWKDFDNYHMHFEDALDEKIVGESTTAYTMQPAFMNVAPRIFKYNPNAKLIYIVRDPIERAISNYWWNVHLCQETRKPLEAIKAELQYLKTSDYAYQIKPYFDLFDPSQIKIVQFEQMVESPKAVVEEVCDWLGVDCKLDKPEIFSTVKAKGDQNIHKANTERLLGKLRASRFWRVHMRKYVPDSIRQLGKPMASQSINRESSDILDEIRQVNIYLRPILSECTEEFRQYAQLDYSKWTTLYPE